MMLRNSLLEILQSRFGHSQFRPHQEAVCDSVYQGKDALVVMPTGAGKSLCYQIPGLARGGTTLVISPLVALIEDQVNRLISRGIKAGRIHSGRSREDSRETFKSYLKGELEFLFIAPERLAVPGFSEMLIGHPPSLIAVDEAHCISHWGHDFRPDYRLVGERLSGLKNTPIVALTATATPLVQQDICNQLKLKNPTLFIHGFRRENLAIQLVDALPSHRGERILEVLTQSNRLPAIVYAPTRKKAEELSKELNRKLKTSAYHAGMPSERRESVQSSFLQGDIDVIVATVAFGMGIDKSNVRTVIHAALPGSIESYYQEIGRAGRDGGQASAILFHGFSDRKTHEFFMDRDHPEVSILETIYGVVELGNSIQLDDLRQSLRGIDPDVFEKAIEKLWMHGGLKIDPFENVSRGENQQWKKLYIEQREHKVAQLDAMQAYTVGAQCRMNALVQHFGDRADSSLKCGICDRCAPPVSTRTLNELEKMVAALTLASLEGKSGQAVGRLFEEVTHVDSRISRSGYERVLSALSRSKLVDIENAEFEKDGKKISFRKVQLLVGGKSAKKEDLEKIEIDGDPMGEVGARSSRVKKRIRDLAQSKAAHSKSHASNPSMRVLDSGQTSEIPKLFEELRQWRLSEARKKGVPAFRILSDRVLHAICEDQPNDEAGLLAVPGLGPKLVAKYGQDLLSKIRRA